MIYQRAEVPPSTQPFIFASTRDKVKLDVDALDDFIQNLLMCFLCTINLKPLEVSPQSVASAALLLPGEMISCFANCCNGDNMHINGGGEL